MHIPKSEMKTVSFVQNFHYSVKKKIHRHVQGMKYKLCDFSNSACDLSILICQASQVAPVVKNLPANAGDTEMQFQSWGQEDSLEEEMASHSSILAWTIPWTEEPGGLQSMGLQRVGHN